MFGRDERGIGQGQPAPAAESNAPRKGGELVVDDVVALQVLLQLLDIVNLHHQAQAFADEHEEGVDQGLGRLAADVGFLPFAVLLHILIGQALDLLVCELHTDDLFGLAGRNKDGQLLALGGNVVAGCYKASHPASGPGVGRGFQHLHNFVHHGVVSHGYIGVSVFNDSFHIGQQGLQLPDDPRHGVGHGLQSQRVAVEQHEAQIFLTRGFDDSGLRFEGLCAKPFQKLREHSELVQLGGRVHVYV